VTELRLALVCYGGVSLAVYMHGVTKELHKLVRASRRFDEVTDLDAPNPFGADGERGDDTEHAYFEALREMAAQGRRTSISIDIIAGASAGGINGVALSKALARDATQDGLRRLWIDEADLRKLLRAIPVGGVRLRTLLAGLRQLRSLNDPTSPLRGEQMSFLLGEALSQMDKASGKSTLLPEQGTLELFVTATDLHGFEVLVPSGAGGASQRDRYHAQVFQFSARAEDTADFGPANTATLAFSARASSSFPGAFTPVNMASFAQELRTTGSTIALDSDSVSEHLRFRYEEGGASASDAWFVDGGVLDNAPFDLVIQSISRKRAETEVVRRVIYIQPDPGRPLGTPAQPDSKAQEPPGWLEGVWRSVAGVKGTHSILLDLLRFRDMNTRIAEIGAIASSQMDEVLRTIDQALADSDLSQTAGDTWDLSDLGDVRRVTEQLHHSTGQVLGVGGATYVRLKMAAAGRRLTDEIARRFVTPPDSSRSSFVRAAVTQWLRQQEVWSDPTSSGLVDLLRPVDIPYRERRLMFLLAGINDFYARITRGEPGPSRTDLDQLKCRAWDLLDHLRASAAAAVVAVPDEAIAFLNTPAIETVLLREPAEFAAQHTEDFRAIYNGYRDGLTERLGDASSPLWQAYQDVTSQWDLQWRKQLLARYLGFPLWDGLIFPIVALAEVPQFSPITMTQFSPLTAGALPTPDGGKLQGVSFHHFGGFLAGAARENDYLWGRLDAAELILRTLRASITPGASDGPVVPSTPEQALTLAGGELCRTALRSVLSSERELDRIAELRSWAESALESTTLGTSTVSKPRAAAVRARRT
jgi:patatin-related protein